MNINDLKVRVDDLTIAIGEKEEALSAFRSDNGRLKRTANALNENDIVIDLNIEVQDGNDMKLKNISSLASLVQIIIDDNVGAITFLETELSTAKDQVKKLNKAIVTLEELDV